MLTVGIIGLGRLGVDHLKSLLKIRDIEVKVVCDNRIEVAEQVANNHKIEQFTDSPDHIFQDDTIDAVVIVSPTPTHYELVTAALRANKAVFVEKPLTIDLEQSLLIEQVVKETNGYCQVGFMRRFDFDYMEAKRMIDEGHIGKPIYFKGINRDPFPPPIGFIEKSGGIFVDLMIHDIDIAHFLMGEKITDVAAFGGIIKYLDFKQANDVDQALLHLHFESGAIGDVEGSRCALYGFDVRTEIIGTEGSLLIGSNRRSKVQLLNKKGSTQELLPIFQERFQESYINELTAFAQAVLNNEPSVCTVENSIQALKVSYAATASFRQNGVLTSTNI